MNGWIRILKRQSGHEKRRRSYYIWWRYSLVSGGLLLLELEEHRHNVWNIMKSSWIKLKEEKQMKMIRESWSQEKLTQTLKPKPHDLIQSTWMKMTKKWFKKPEPDWPTQEGKRLTEKLERKSLKNLDDRPTYSKTESLRLQESTMLLSLGEEK